MIAVQHLQTFPCEPAHLILPDSRETAASLVPGISRPENGESTSMPFASGATGLRIPSVEDIDPSFIFISPAVTKGSEFQAGEEYLEPVPPRVIDGVDYQAQRDSAVRDAERFVRAKSDLLGSAGSTVYDRVFAIMKHRRYRAGTLAQTRFEENKDIFRPTITARL